MSDETTDGAVQGGGGEGGAGGDAGQDATRAAAAEAAAGKFRGFGRDQWVSWINKFLNGELCDPQVLVGVESELHIVLAGVYNGLETKSQRDVFAEAVAVLFACTPPIKQNERYFYYLIEMLAFLRPYQARSLARTRLYNGTFRDWEYGMQNLHTMLLIANSKYDLDEDLVDYIRRTARASEDFGYLLVCQRLLSTLGGREYVKFFDVLLPRLKTSPCAARLARQLRAILRRVGHRHFAEWYGATARAARKDGGQPGDAFQLFEEAIKKIVFSRLDLESLADDDPHRALVAAQLRAYDTDGRYNARQVVAVARLHEHVGQDAAVDALVNIWRRIETSQSGQPWWYNAPPARSRFKLPATVSSGPNPNASVSASFDIDQEPGLDAIFEKVKNVCEYRLRTPDVIDLLQRRAAS